MAFIHREISVVHSADNDFYTWCLAGNALACTPPRSRRRPRPRKHTKFEDDLKTNVPGQALIPPDMATAMKPAGVVSRIAALPAPPSHNRSGACSPADDRRRSNPQAGTATPRCGSPRLCRSRFDWPCDWPRLHSGQTKEPSSFPKTAAFSERFQCGFMPPVAWAAGWLTAAGWQATRAALTRRPTIGWDQAARRPD